MNNRIEKAQLAAHAVKVNDWDYYPYALEGYPESYSIYNYCDGIWLVDTKNSVDRDQAEKLIMIIKH